MAPIPEDQTVLITLDYLKAKNVAARGTVTITPPRFIVPAEEAIVVNAPVDVIVEAGEAEVRIIPSDAGTFRIDELLDGVSQTWHINIPTALAGTTRSLFSFASVQPIVQGVAVNTMLSGSGAPANTLGIDGDYYYDVPGKFWYGPKALGAWPAGFSVVGPPGTNGTNGTNGQQGPPGTPGTRLRIVQAYITSGNIVNMADTGGLWRKPGDATGLPLDFVIQLPAAVGDWVECGIRAMRSDTASVWLDVAVQKGNDVVKYLSTGTNQPPFEGDPAWYSAPFRSVSSVAPGFYATEDEIEGGVVKFVLANRSAGQGTLYASAQYPFIWSARNLGPAPV